MSSLGWFIQYVGKNNIARFALAAVISERISEITSGCIEYIVMPIINADINNNGIRDIDEIRKLEDKEIVCRGVKIKIGKVIFSIIKFIIAIFIIFIVTTGARKMIDFE